MLGVCAGQSDADWLKLNAGQTGLYRVHYPDELWDRLTRVAARVIDDVPILPEVDFAGLLDDAWALNDAGGLPVHIFLNLTRCARGVLHVHTSSYSPACSTCSTMCW